LTARRFPPPWSVEESDIKEAVTARFFPGKQMGGNVDAQALIIWLIVGAVAGWLAGMVVKGGGFGLIGDIIVGMSAHSSLAGCCRGLA